MPVRRTFVVRVFEDGTTVLDDVGRGDRVRIASLSALGAEVTRRLEEPHDPGTVPGSDQEGRTPP
jgi:hypothetical protein